MSGNRISQAIPSFINAVSQQPASIRLPSQCEELRNGWPTVSDGLRKRPPTQHLAKLWGTDVDMTDAFVHLMNRDANERYKMFIANGDLKVIDLLNGPGTEMTVTFPNGKGYLVAGDPWKDFSAVTVADYTFIVNKKVVAKMSNDLSPTPPNEALVFVKLGYTATQYSIYLNGQHAGYYVPAAEQGMPNTRATHSISSELRSAVLALGGFTCDLAGSVLRIRKSDGSDFTFSVYDSWGEQALIGIKGRVDAFTDLPPKAFEGVKVAVKGDDKTGEDDYYVSYNAEGGTKTGTWDEIRGFDIPYKFDASTLPHVLIRNADFTFTFKEAEWSEAKVGDEETCPSPSFIDRQISSVFFFRNRLGFTSGENFVFSRQSEFFNLWPKTATTVLATDPIDYAVSDGGVTNLNFAIPFRDDIILLADSRQFQLGNGNASSFGPETVRVDVSTRYDASAVCPPVGAGSNLYFPYDRGSNSSIMEYYVMTDGVTNDAVDVAAHVPRYIPENLYRLVASTDDGYLMGLTRTIRNKVYVYKYFWIDNDKVQSAWSEWEFRPEDILVGIASVGSSVYLTFQRPDGVYEEIMDVQSVAPDEGLPFQVHLDRKVWLPPGDYSEKTNETIFMLPYAINPGESVSLVCGPDFPAPGREYIPAVYEDDPTLVVLEGRYDHGPMLAGKQYRFLLRFSEQFVRESKDQAAAVIAGGRLQLLSMRLLHRDSGYFRTMVQSKGRDPQFAYHLGRLGDAGFRINRAISDSIPHKFQIFAKSDQVTIEVDSDKHYPVTLLSAEWEALFNIDARRA